MGLLIYAMPFSMLIGLCFNQLELRRVPNVWTSVRVLRYGTHPFKPSSVPLAASTNKGAATFAYKMEGLNHIRRIGANTLTEHVMDS